MIEEFKKIGFQDKEAQLYILLIEKGELSAPKIAEILNLHRRTVYDILNKLIKNSYVSSKKINNKEVYSATDPKTIVRETYDNYLNFKKVISKLKTKEKNELRLNILQGHKAIKILVNNWLRSKEEASIIGRGGETIEQLKDSIYQYIPKTKQLKWKMIQKIEYKERYKGLFKPDEIRFLTENINLETGFMVFSNRVYLFSKEKEIKLIEIIDENFAKTFKTYFEIIWKQAEK